MTTKFKLVTIGVALSCKLVTIGVARSCKLVTRSCKLVTIGVVWVQNVYTGAPVIRKVCTYDVRSTENGVHRTSGQRKMSTRNLWSLDKQLYSFKRLFNLKEAKFKTF
jgi:hypothetical protein